MRKIFLFLFVLLCVLSLSFSGGADLWAKSKKSKKKKGASAPRVNGIEAMIEAQKRGEAIEIVDPDNPKKRIRIEPPKASGSPALLGEVSVQSPETQMGGDGGRAVPLTIVIDPGHGGKDPGAIGAFGKKKKAWTVREKDIVLQISKHLEAALKKRLKAKVYYTRPNDTFITLGERNRIANRRQCDLFLSIHANAAKNPKAKGLEIYSLNKATDEASRRLAARENEGAPAEEKDIEAIVSDLTQTAAAEESAILAGTVEGSFRKRLKTKYGIERLETKTALFYVLVGAKCPGLLIETGFVTNEGEGKRLTQPAYQKDMAKAIAEGVAAYLAKSEQSGGDL